MMEMNFFINFTVNLFLVAVIQKFFGNQINQHNLQNSLLILQEFKQIN